MSTLRKVANALSFAHLAGFAGKARSESDDPEDPDKKKKDDDAKARAEEGDDEERKKKDDESEDDYAKRMKAMDDEDEDKKKKDDDAKAKADDDGDEEMRSTASAEAQRERARCASIVAFGVKNNCIRQAGVFAFDTDMTSKQAIGALIAAGAEAPKAPVPSHQGRADRNPRVGAGASGTLTSRQATESRWDAAFAKVTPPKRH